MSGQLSTCSDILSGAWKIIVVPAFCWQNKKGIRYIKLYDTSGSPKNYSLLEITELAKINGEVYVLGWLQLFVQKTVGSKQFFVNKYIISVNKYGLKLLHHVKVNNI